ncbi:sigma-70 family RNA polymerase sigma factor [Yinghuangia soli]|uniref:Sigma-70 family RNA polymerase sigma factor n=1 Tax=Yinghuangia soli TaxID=2908204 RepID=A0AA41U514_9ACTN|nr:sigma-70 family RNA polymerase sigma factor [Yinghuangia soli]MCF2531407.1 sigma-70 family RNA polymerase sigma factor [Yinghuangia soli]
MVGVVPHSRDDEADHRGLLRGDEQTLGRLYDAYADFVFGVALGVTREESSAEDITCEVFVALWERPYDYDPAQWSLGAWLVAGAHRRAVVRRGAAQTAQSARAAGSESVGKDSTASTDSTAGFAADGAVAATLAGLAPELRDVVELAYFQGLTYREVAAKLGLGETVVAERVRNGLWAWADDTAPTGGRAAAEDDGTGATT